MKGKITKLLATIFAFATILAGVCFLSPEASEVKAGNLDVFHAEKHDIADYTEAGVRIGAPKPDPTSEYKDWLFAGWYKDEACSSYVTTGVRKGEYWAKFVPAEVLSVQCQASAGTIESSESSKLRIISTVDNLVYKQVGFDLVYKEKTIQYKTNTVYKKIEAAVNGVDYGYSPNVFDVQSTRFITATITNIKKADFDEGILIKPYWVTMDGTKVYGVSRYARVEDSYLKIVNVPVRLYSDDTATNVTTTFAYDSTKLRYLDTYGTVSTPGNTNGDIFDGITVADNDTGTLTITGTSDAAEKTDGIFAHLRLQILDNQVLPRKNIFDVIRTNGNGLALDGRYTNLRKAAFTNTVDRNSWYDENSSKYVITTAEELYGFASRVNDGTVTNQTVYLGTDITVFEGTAANWGTSAPGTGILAWTSIGDTNSKFTGTFEGQGYTISGLYQNTPTDGWAGLFREANGTVKNFSLKNSYFGCAGNMMGSIAAFLSGQMMDVYSNAHVVNMSGKNLDESVDYDTGGLIGRYGSGSTSKISNCWFDGSVTSNNRDLGGLVGRVGMGVKSITHCLNSGTVTNTISDAGAWTGGLVGSVDPQVEGISLTLTDSLNVGTVTSTVSTVGSVIGYIKENTYNPVVNLENVYATQESYVNSSAIPVGVANGTIDSGRAELCPEKTLTGYTGYLKADLDYYTNINKSEGGYWVTTADGTPTLKTFTEYWADLGWYYDDPDITTYEISTIEELYGFAEFSTRFDFEGETIKLAKDIEFNQGHAEDWLAKAPKNAWIPIGSKDIPFKGTFDGQGHTISGLYVHVTGATGSESFAGFFGATDAKATIKNLKLKNSCIYGPGYFVGSIAGRGNGTFDTVYSDAVVCSSTGVVGGFAGQVNADTTVKNCWFAGDVWSSSATEVGGFFGALSGTLNLTMSDCLVSGEVNGNQYVGGLVGQVRQGNTLLANSCLNVATITGTTNGNFVGQNAGTAKIAFSYGLYPETLPTIGSTTGTSYDTFGVARFYEAATIHGTEAYPRTMGLDYVNTWVAKTGSTPELKSFSSNSNNETVPATQVYYGWYNDWDSEYIIKTAEGLKGLSNLTNKTIEGINIDKTFAGKTVKLGANISLNEGGAGTWGTTPPKNQWTPIASGGFAGTFDGQGHTIIGVYVNVDADNSYAGLFAQTTATATVKNLRVSNSYIKGTGYIVGSIAGRGNGTFDSVYSDALVVSDKGVVGGLVGQVNANTKATNCWYAGKVSSSGNEVGGLFGALQGSITLTMDNCLASLIVEGADYVGGIVGKVRSGATLNVRSCLNVATISGTTKGNIVGWNEGTSKIVYSYGLLASELIGSSTGTNTMYGNARYTDKSVIYGAETYERTVGLDFDNYWTAKAGSTPELKKFTSSSGSLSVGPNQVYEGWYDGSTGTYTITTAAGLRGLSKLADGGKYFAGSTVKLGADIVLNKGNLDPNGTKSVWDATVADWSKWTPIKQFDGTFNGQGHTISGMYVESSASGVGLFSFANSNSKIQNLRLEDSYIYSTNEHTGSIAGWGYGSMDSVYSDAIIVATNVNVGGIIGVTQREENSAGQEITNVWYAGAIQAGSDSQTIGGILGCTNNTSTIVNMTNCLVTGSITSTTTSSAANIGGFVGRTMGETNFLYCLHAGTMTVNASAKYIGQGIGQDNGLQRYQQQSIYSTATNITNDTGYDSAPGESGVVYDVAKSKIMGVYGKTNTPNLFVSGASWSAMIDSVPVPTVFAKDVKIVADTSWYDASKDEFVITKASELYGLAKLSESNSFANKTIKLGANITLNMGDASGWGPTTAPTNKWTPIKAFGGTFDGQGNTIYGMYVNKNGNAGLFEQTTASSVVKNLYITNSYVYSTHDNNGVVAGIGGGTFDTIYSDATVVCHNRYYTGGLIGIVNSGNNNKINNCQFAGNVKMTGASGYYGGGIVGTVINDGVKLYMTNCLSSGNISTERGTSNHVVGGLCGAAYSGGYVHINSCMHTGTFTMGSTTAVGSAIGSIHNDGGAKAKINNTYFTSTNYWQTYTGSLVPPRDDHPIELANTYGELAHSNMMGLDYNNYWVAKSGAAPELRSFQSSIANVEADGLTPYIGWYDGSGDYTITTPGGLYGFEHLCNNNRQVYDASILGYREVTGNGFTGEIVRLGADITLNTGEATSWSSTNAPTNTFRSLGYNNGLGFLGTFDGQGHTIKGLYISGSDGYATGLFYYTRPGSTVKNLRLENSYIYNNTRQYIGSIAGTGQGTIENVYSSAIVEVAGEQYYIGGIVGGSYGEGNTLNVDNCWFAGTLKLGTAGYYAGGIVGTATGGTELTMSNCLMSGTITGSRTGSVYVGGLCGASYGGTIKLNSSVYRGKMTLADGVAASNTAIGGITISGTAYISNTYVTAYTDGQGATVVDGTLQGNVVYRASMVGADAFAMIGLDFTDAWVAKSGDGPELRSFASSTANIDTPKGQIYTGWYDGLSDTYTITTKGGLKGLSKLCEDDKANYFQGKTVKLGADIILNEGTIDVNATAASWNASVAGWAEWTPIPVFSGTFDGDGHRISGMYVSATSAGVGLFSKATEDSTIKNLKIENSYISSQYGSVGSIAGWGNGTIDSVYSSAVVAATADHVGGLVGTTQDTTNRKTISNSWFAGAIRVEASSENVGGIIGYMYATNAQTTWSQRLLENCLVTGSITSASTSSVANVGGFCGYCQGDLNINSSLHAGTITTASGAGGIGQGVGNKANLAYVRFQNTSVYSTATGISKDIGIEGWTTDTGKVYDVEKTSIYDGLATTNAPNLQYSTNWSTLDGKVPVLTDFVDYAATLLGTAISQYQIVVGENSHALVKLLAGYLQTLIKNATTVTVDVVSDVTDASACEIVIGDTNRAISDTLYTGATYNNEDYSYTIQSSGTTIAVGYSDSPALVDAFKAILDEIVNKQSANIAITYEYNKADIDKAEASYVRVMSSNIFNSEDRTSFAEIRAVVTDQMRAKLLAECYLLYKPDFIGMQEADQAMRAEVYKWIAHEYQMVEMKLASGDNNWCPIFYRRDAYNLVEANFEKLDSIHYFEWAVYTSKANPSQQFIHMNVHYNVDEVEAISQALIVNKIIKEVMAQYPNAPIAITGDYNFTATECVYRTMMRGISDNMKSGSQVIANDDSKYYTWHTLGSLQLKETYESKTTTPSYKYVFQQGPIDHVSITTKLVTPIKYKMLHYPLICYAADHYPIFLDMAIK